MHALRHFYASVLLDAGENVKALSAYLGHNDPGFTLRVYTHLMPSCDARARKAVDSLYDGPVPGPARPQTANGRPRASETPWGRRSTTVGPTCCHSGKPALTCPYSTGRFFRSSKAVTSERYSSHSWRLLRRKKSKTCSPRVSATRSLRSIS